MRLLPKRSSSSGWGTTGKKSEAIQFILGISLFHYLHPPLISNCVCFVHEDMEGGWSASAKFLLIYGLCIHSSSKDQCLCVIRRCVVTYPRSIYHLNYPRLLFPLIGGHGYRWALIDVFICRSLIELYSLVFGPLPELGSILIWSIHPSIQYKKEWEIDNDRWLIYRLWLTVCMLD